MIEAEKNEIINALKVLKSTCLSFQGTETDDPDVTKCEECPLSDPEPTFYYRCKLMYLVPLHYDINNPNDIWRALK